MGNVKTLTVACKAAVVGAAGACAAGIEIYILAEIAQPHVLDFELSGLAGLFMATLGGFGAGALGGAIGRALGRRPGSAGWLASIATVAALGAIGMGAVWYLTFFHTSYIPLDTRLWVAVMMVVAGAFAGALGGLVGRASVSSRRPPDRDHRADLRRAR